MALDAVFRVDGRLGVPQLLPVRRQLHVLAVIDSGLGVDGRPRRDHRVAVDTRLAAVHVVPDGEGRKGLDVGVEGDLFVVAAAAPSRRPQLLLLVVLGAAAPGVCAAESAVALPPQQSVHAGVVLLPLRDRLVELLPLGEELSEGVLGAVVRGRREGRGCGRGRGGDGLEKGRSRRG